MGVGSGYKTWAGFAPEVTYGTAAAPTKYVEISEESLQRKRPLVEKKTLRRISRDKSVKGKVTVEGGLVLPFNWTGAEHLLRHALGSMITSGAGPYTHTFTPTEELPVGLTIRVNRDVPNVGGSADVYTGCQIKKMTLKQSLEDYLMMTLDIIGKDRTTAADSSPTYPVFDQIDWEMLTVSTIGGVQFDINEFEYTVENILAEDRFKMGQISRIGLGRGDIRKISIKQTGELDNVSQAFLDHIYNLTGVALVNTWTSGAKSLTISCPNARCVGEPPTVKEKGPIPLSLMYDAFISAAENDESTITLINNTATP